MAIQETDVPLYPEVLEAPRYSCALGGAYTVALATFGTVPILHSGAGCGLGQLFGQHYAGGQNSGGPQGTTSTPCTGLVEEHVVFGGEDKLRKLIKSSIELMNGDLFAVISGCVPALIGDDIDAVVREFQEETPIIHVKTAGFVGNSYKGYELFFDAVINQLLTPLPVEKKLVNIFGVVPSQHVFWKGNLRVVKELLESIGLKVNIIFTEQNGLENLKRIPAAELNLVLSPWIGINTAKKLEEKFGTPFEVLPSVPVGPKETTKFLEFIGKKLKVSPYKIKKKIAQEEKDVYRFAEYMGDILLIGLPHAFYGVVSESSTAIGLVKYATNELGYIPELVIITDNPPEKYREEIKKHLLEGLESVIKPKVIFEEDSHKIRLILEEASLQLILASSLEKHLSLGDAIHLSVSFPMYDRLILDRTYAGYRGGLALMEDIAAKYAGPL